MVDHLVPSNSLPTTPSGLYASVPDVKTVAKAWFTAFSTALSTSDIQSLSNLFVPDAFWRDMLALTWDFRTFSGLRSISQFLTDRLSTTHPTAFSLRDDEYLKLQQPYPDVTWINMMFDFDTQIGIASGIARLVLTSDGKWKANTVYTNLENLKGFPENKGTLKSHEPNHGKWEEDRRTERKFEDREPVVLIIGGGECGLQAAARLSRLDVPTLVVEKNPRIGDTWRNRFKTFSMHDPVYYNYMPYIPFPENWPVYAPVLAFADWLESYASSLELNVWTSSTVVSAVQNTTNSKWKVTIQRADGELVSKEVKHLVFATGYGSGDEGVVRPSYSGMDKFKGQILHYSQYKQASDYVGKKVVVVGSSTSAHNTAVDCYEHGLDVTMFQQNSTYVLSSQNGWQVIMSGRYSGHGAPTDIADRVSGSFAHHMGVDTRQRITKKAAVLDKDLLDGLRARGFQMNEGLEGTGVGLLLWINPDGLYFNTGGSQLIIDGKIKLKSGPQIKQFTEHAILFDNGSKLEADVVIFNGLGDTHVHIRRICGDAVAHKCKPIWGLDTDGEIYGAWRDMGVKGLWYLTGNIGLARFYSKHFALQVKAMEEGIFGERYSILE